MASKVQDISEETTTLSEENFDKKAQVLLNSEKQFNSEKVASIQQPYEENISSIKFEEKDSPFLVISENSLNSHEILNELSSSQQIQKDINMDAPLELTENEKKSSPSKELLENCSLSENVEMPTSSQKSIENLKSIQLSNEDLINSVEHSEKLRAEEDNSENHSIVQQKEQNLSLSKQSQLNKTSTNQKKVESSTSTPNIQNSSPKNKSISSKHKRVRKKDKVKPPSKIVIRRLPPTMSEFEFLEQVKPLPDHDAYYYAGPDWSLGFDATCRAYFTVTNFDDVFLFCQRFDGYIFVDDKGCEYSAIVEFAPYQGLAKTRSRRDDNKVNTIEQEPHFEDFVERLNANREAAAKASEKKLEFSLESKKEEKVTSTPLLQYLANKKEKRREDNKKRVDEKRRQREEEKEKRKQAQEQSQQITKIISNSGKAENKNATKEVHDDHHKNTRSKRRAERDQRRREEHEFRKREKEKEQRENRNTEKSEDSTIGSNNESKQNNKKLLNIHEPEEGKQQLRRESKRNEKGERDRDRNRNRRDKRNNRNNESKSNLNSENCAMLDGTSSSIVKKSADEGSVNVNEHGKQFKEFESKEMEVQCEISERNQKEKASIRSKLILKKEKPNRNNRKKEYSARSTDNHIDRQSSGTGSNLDEMQVEYKEEKCTSNRSNNKSSESNRGEFLEDQQRQQSQRSKEELQKRIRNKDRPSIAIYQPRARRLNEESDSSKVNYKDSVSNPTSDCENVKKEEQRSTRRVKRNSEKRTEKVENTQEENTMLEKKSTNND